MTAYFRSLAARFFYRSQTENELEEELRAHIQLRADDLERLGLTRSEAERRARIEFGGRERVKEECREELGGNFIDILMQDVRFSLRMLRKSPGFSAVAIMTMALCIGATTAIFSVVDATLLHPLPYPHPEQLVRITDDLPSVGAQDVGMSEPEWQDLQHSGIFEYVSPAWYDDNNLIMSACACQSLDRGTGLFCGDRSKTGAGPHVSACRSFAWIYRGSRHQRRALEANIRK